MNTQEQIFAICRAHGIPSPAYLPGAEIVYDRDFRAICESNGCGCYGRCYMCPPHIGEIDTLMREAKSYPHCVLFHTVGQLEDSFDFEGMTEAKNAHMRVALAVAEKLKALPCRHLLLVPGGCGVCARCAQAEGKPCRFPEKAHSSPEGYGIFVSETAKRAGLSYCNGANTVTYFSLILFDDGAEA